MQTIPGPAQPVRFWSYHFFLGHHLIEWAWANSPSPCRRGCGTHVALSIRSQGCNYTMASSSCSRFVVPDLPPARHQPSRCFVFPKRTFGKKNVVWRSFQQSWFNQWTWLHYDEANDVTYCHTCVTSNSLRDFPTGRMQLWF